ncbi:YaiI/YqxD family protein [Deferrisoma camini]|uniref:YaiI/YqxD family protein n=1 Tax=Deferrisoma camini TaxID=1035120 RepID=UPI0004A4FA26|nr:YaiI/YqxD family protein [Deferrisoma camini]
MTGPVIYVDADGCPVKDEVYRVARRVGARVYVVSARPLAVPKDPQIQAVGAGGAFDAADDWIAERVGPGSVVVTTDVPLAARCVDKGAWVLGPKGNLFTPHNIGEALARRELNEQLRQMGLPAGGPAPFQKADRSRFLQRLDEVLQAIRRGIASPPATYY